MKIPSQYLPVMPYLILEEPMAFLRFSEIVFEAKTQLIVPGEDKDVLHAEIKIGDAVIMFGHAGGEWKEKTAAMFMYVEDVNKVYDQALQNKAESLEAPQHKDYGFTAGFADPFGNHWFIVEAEKQSRS